MISKALKLYARTDISLKKFGLNKAALPIPEADKALTNFEGLLIENRTPTYPAQTKFDGPIKPGNIASSGASI